MSPQGAAVAWQTPMSADAIDRLPETKLRRVHDKAPHSVDMDAATITVNYDVEGYASMSCDEVRNSAYAHAIAAAVAVGPGQQWLEIGPGAHAFLTLKLLDADPAAHVVAVEMNAASAAKATRELDRRRRDRGRWRVVTHDAATWEPGQAADALAGRPAASWVLQEVFGMWASSEGVVGAVLGARRAGLTLPNAHVVMRFAATFCVPVNLTMDAAFRGSDDEPLYVSDKVVLLKRFAFDEHRLAATSAAFERHDLEDVDPPGAQENEMRFDVTKAGEFNGLATFLWFGSGVAGSAPDRAGPAPPSSAKFPYGDAATGEWFAHRRFDARTHTNASSNVDDGAAASSNWRNVVVRCPQPCAVAVGDMIHIRTVCTMLRTATPAYTFAMSVEHGDRTRTDLVPATVAHADLYTDWVKRIDDADDEESLGSNTTDEEDGDSEGPGSSTYEEDDDDDS